jgi:hypothetical protein
MPLPLHSLPSIRPSQVQQSTGEGQLHSSPAVVAAMYNGPPLDGGPVQPPPLKISPETLLESQSWLQDAQSSQIDRIKSLKSILAEQEALTQEMRVLCDLMKARELDLFQLVAERGKDTSRRLSSNFEHDEDGEEDDAKNVMVAAGFTHYGEVIYIY